MVIIESTWLVVIGDVKISEATTITTSTNTITITTTTTKTTTTAIPEKKSEKVNFLARNHHCSDLLRILTFVWLWQKSEKSRMLEWSGELWSDSIVCLRPSITRGIRCLCHLLCVIVCVLSTRFCTDLRVCVVLRSCVCDGCHGFNEGNHEKQGYCTWQACYEDGNGIGASEEAAIIGHHCQRLSMGVRPSPCG